MTKASIIIVALLVLLGGLTAVGLWLRRQDTFAAMIRETNNAIRVMPAQAAYDACRRRHNGFHGADKCAMQLELLSDVMCAVHGSGR